MSQLQLEEDVFTGRVDWGLWRRLAGFAAPYRWQVAGVCTMAMLVAGCDIALPILTARLIDAIKRDGADLDLWRYAVPYAAVFVLLAGCVLGFIAAAGKITVGVSTDIRTAAFRKLQLLPFSYYDKRAVGWLMARLTGDCASLSRVMAWGLLDICWGICLLSGVGLVMFVHSWKLALILLSVAPVLFLVSWWFQVRLLKTSRAIRKSNSIVTAGYNEGLQGVRTSKTMVREARNAAEFSGLTSTLHRHTVRNALYSALFLPTVMSLCSVGVALSLWQGGSMVLGGTMTLGTLVMFVQYASLIVYPSQELANTFAMIQGAQASAERIVSLLDEPITIRDSDAVVARLAKYSTDRPTGLAADGHPDRVESIEFENVSFEYTPGRPVLQGVNFVVRAGQTVALVGPTGGGKSTIVSLACRFYEATSGRILIDGVDLRERSLRWLQSKLGTVLQQPHLFSGSIRENIRYGRLEATDAEVEAAARATNAHKFISEFPAGYDTSVGEGGNQLSTGQKQLIALARAVLADPRIFVMDEATSSVDTQTERDIQAAVEKALQGRISFVIAHRLSTIRNADLILVICDGRIVEQGNHHQLINRRGRYFELYTQQFTVERQERLLQAS